MVDDAPEGWHVRHRPAVLAAATTPLILGLLLFGAGQLYVRKVKPATRQPVHVFPAPGLETYIHDGANDPKRVPPRLRRDGSIAVAKHAVVRDGLAGWVTAR